MMMTMIVMMMMMMIIIIIIIIIIIMRGGLSPDAQRLCEYASSSLLLAMWDEALNIGSLPHQAMVTAAPAQGTPGALMFHSFGCCVTCPESLSRGLGSEQGHSFSSQYWFPSQHHWLPSHCDRFLPEGHWLDFPSLSFKTCPCMKSFLDSIRN